MMLQYQSLAAPVMHEPPVPAPDRSWSPSYPDRVWPRRGLWASLQRAWAFDRYDAPTPISNTIGGADPSVGSMRFRQYQSKFGPIYIPSAAPAFDAALQAHLLPSVVLRAKVRGASQQMAEPIFGAVTDVPVQSWLNNVLYAAPAKQRVPRPMTPHPSWFGPQLVADVTQPVTALSWLAKFADKVWPLRGLHASQQRTWVADQFDAPGAPVVTPLSWRAKYPDRTTYAKLRAVEFLTPSAQPWHVPDVTHAVTALSWKPNYADRVPPLRGLLAALQRAYQADRFDEPFVVPAPSIAAMLATYPDQPGRARKPLVQGSTHATPIYLADITVVAPRLAQPVYPDRIHRLKVWPAWNWVSTFEPSLLGSPVTADLIIRCLSRDYVVVVDSEDYILLLPTDKVNRP